MEYFAKNIGSGNIEVFSITSLISFIENTARELIKQRLEENLITINTLVNIRHFRQKQNN